MQFQGGRWLDEWGGGRAGGGVQCYEELLSKFSGSASLHHDYAEFCEAVLNDAEKASKYRHGAEILESGAS